MSAARRTDRLVIGLTGSFGSGCSTVAGILQATRDFHVEGLSTPIKEEAEKEGRSPDRRTLQTIGDDLRREHGNDYLALRAVAAAEKAAKDRNWVLDGIRNIAEIETLRRQLPSFYLMAVDASRDTRYARLKGLYGRNEADFDRDDERDRSEPYCYGQQVAACVDRADVLLINEQDFSRKPRLKRDLAGGVSGYVTLMASPGSRLPSPRELLMHWAYSASLRSSCLKRQVGAVIAAPYDGKAEPREGLRPADDRFAVVAAGYNEVPRGQEACRDQYDGECYRDRRRHQQSEKVRALKLRCECGEVVAEAQCGKCGKDLAELYRTERSLDYCRALHAEETAILQGTRTGGPALSGTVLYVTTFPCLLCAKMIVHAGIKEVVYVEAYPVVEATEFLRDARVAISRFEGVKAQAFYRLFKSAPS